MVTVRKAVLEELERFVEVETQPHAIGFLVPTSFDQHVRAFEDPDITYLTIENSEGGIAGYFIVVKEEQPGSVEFRRIALDRTALGSGQVAIAAMEDYCRMELQATRIWLDVYADNGKAKYVYEKLGYRHFRTTQLDGRELLLYEKAFPAG